MARQASVGPELDALVEELQYPDRVRIPIPAYSTDRCAAMLLLEHLAAFEHISIEWTPSVSDDDDGGLWVCETYVIPRDVPYYETYGEGKTLLEAICRAATHVQDEMTEEG